MDVPQGSCLELLLFLPFIEDLPCCLKDLFASMYADDTNIYYASESDSEMNQAVNAELEAMKGWPEGNMLSLNKLSINVAKTEALIIGSNGKQRKIDFVYSIKPHFKIGSEDIMLVNEVKYIGVQVEHELKWTSISVGLTAS